MNKEVKIGLAAAGIIVILLAALAGLDYWMEQRKIVKEKDPNLTQEERAIYEERLATAREMINNPDLNDSQRFDWYMQQGFQLYGLGKLAEASDSYKEALKFRPEDPNAYVALYAVQLDMQDNDSALKNIQKAVELKPTDPDIWKKYILIQKERFGVAGQELNDLYLQALEKTLNNVDINTAYAVHLEQVGNLQAAMEYWQKAAELNPSARPLYEIEIKRLDEAIKAQG
ncbi:MAG TPA: tetratricopeptide repeat protein [Coxiellaceae bacterium]|nr:tetratricopeptide repeat protein [Coxiellaceae bacterium]